MAYKTINPYTNEVVKEFENITDDEVKDAIQRCHQAFLGWKDVAPAQRAELMQAAADLLRERKDEAAKTITLEMGKTLAEAKLEIDICIGMFEDYAKNGEEYLKPRVLPSTKYGEGSVELHYRPQGVIFTVEPWNFPGYQIVRVAAPQLMAGNTVLLKHASIVPQSALFFEKLFADAGFPKDAFINLFIGHDQSELIISDPLVRGVALTGSEGAGSSISALAGKYLKKSTLELGGADAFIVLEDADMDKTVEWAVTGRHWNAGQVCCSSKRMIVVDAVYDEFIEKYRKAVAGLVAGDPMDESTVLAPLSSKQAKEDLAEQVEKAKADGATAEEIDIDIPEQGNFFKPVILTDIPEGSYARTHEFFGPVSQVYRVKDTAEAIKLANDSPYGLGGSIFTTDIERAREIAAQLDTGMVYFNHPTGVSYDIPFGGVKNSGFGRELIDLGLHEFVNIQVVANSGIDDEF